MCCIRIGEQYVLFKVKFSSKVVCSIQGSMLHTIIIFTALIWVKCVGVACLVYEAIGKEPDSCRGPYQEGRSPGTGLIYGIESYNKI